MKVGTTSKVKFKTLMRRLGIGLKETIGTLELLWASTLSNAMDGAIGILSDEEIAVECDWDGEPSVLVDSLVATGWLDRCPVHRLIVHDWEEHCPSFVKGNFEKHKREFAKVVQANSELAPQNVAKQVSSEPAKQPANEPAKHGAKHGASDGATYPILSKSIQSKCQSNSEEHPNGCFHPTASATPLDGGTCATLPEMVFPLQADKTIRLPRDRLERYQTTYGDRIDVVHTLQKAILWLEVNPQKRPRNQRGMLQFLTKWLSREDERERKAIVTNRDGTKYQPLPDDF